MIVWKFAVSKSLKKRVLVKLELPADTFIYISKDGPNGKCRASQAKVLSIHKKDGTLIPNVKTVNSVHDESFKYTVGKVVTPKEAFSRASATCDSGIHFFMSREKAAGFCF